MSKENTADAKKEHLDIWSQLTENPAAVKYQPKDYPKVSIIIPTCNSAATVSLTIDSILSQEYPDYEVIVIDASNDRTIEVIKGYRSNKIRIYSVSLCKRYEMLNKGISQANGEYINFLFPGDFYIFRGTLKEMLTLALDNEKPSMVYCGTLIRDPSEEVKILYRPLTLDLLKRGQQPTSLQSCWFRLDLLQDAGKFNADYELRGGFELLCRFFLYKGFRFISISRVLTDYDLRVVTRTMVLTHFWETMKTIYHYFGFLTTLRWFYYQKDFSRIIKIWFRSFKVAFFGRN